MNNLLRWVIVLFSMTFVQTGSAQFLNLKGKDASGIVSQVASAPKDSTSTFVGYNLTYNIKKEKLTIERTKQKQSPGKRQHYSNIQLDKWSISTVLSDYVFNPLKQSKFSLQGQYDYSFEENKINIEADSKQPLKGGGVGKTYKFDRYTTHSIRPSFEFRLFDAFVTTDGTMKAFDKESQVGLLLGVDISVASTYERAKTFGGPGLGFSFFMGADINSTQHITASKVCQLPDKTITIDGKSYQTQTCIDGKIGTPVSTTLGKLKIDGALPIFKTLKGAKGTFRFRNPQFYFISRLSLDIRPNLPLNSFKADWLVGITLANANRETFGGLMFSMVDLLKLFKKDDVLTTNESLQVQLNLPLTFN